MTENNSAQLSFGGNNIELPVVPAVEGNNGFNIAPAVEGDRRRDVRPRLHEHRSDQVRHHLHRRRCGHPALPRLPDRAAGAEVQLPGDQLPADLRQPSLGHRAGGVRPEDPPPHPAARGAQGLLRRLPARRAPDAGALLGRYRALDLVPGLAGSVRRGAGRTLDHPPAGQDAGACRLRPQEVASARHCSTRTTR